ncbi:MAG TPA: recombinase family protein [Terriglobia bacterium]|nr:recombinase family protein [Terriglobia bacterium]
MAKIERVREVPTRLLDADYLRERAEAGWKLVAIEWQRPVEGGEAEARGLVEEIPFGLRVADDCSRLEEDPTEKEILMLMMDLIVDDFSLSKVAEELNRRRFRTRQGAPWSPASVFNMLPRLIEVGPRIFSSEEWAERRRRLFRMSDGSPSNDRRIM